MADPVDHIEVAKQLAAKVQELQTAQDPHARMLLAREVNVLRELLGPVTAGPALVTLTGLEVSTSTDPAQVLADAKYWFMTRLRDHSPIESSLGPVRVSKRGSWDEVKRGAKHDILKLRLLPAVESIISRGRHHGRVEPHKPRADGLLAFHFFSGVVALPEITVEAGVQIAEDADGNLLYSVTHELSVAWQKKIALDGEGERAPSKESDRGTGNVPVLDAILPESGPSINLSILRVLTTV